MLEKTYQPKDLEERHYKAWEDDGAMSIGSRDNAEPYTIVIPPPNVTGSLHVGHALNNTLQDVLIRSKRMRGMDALWQPGTDHAGIATQMVVERQLDAQGISRHDLGREDFIKKIWDWKAESGGTITGQLRRLGATCDWSRERFTMDDGLSHAVRTVFVELHKQGLMYKAKRLVNWDPKLHTAISDLEVEQRDVDGHLWHIKYPVEGMEGRFITVATTRPETMLGDTAVAVHKDDERYQDIIGKFAVLPLVGRRIPIVADEHADPEQGSGAVKITPAHDFNDHEVGKRHDLEVINILDSLAHIVSGEEAGDVPAKYQGLERYEARKAIVADLEAEGLMEAIEDHAHTVPYGDRSGVVIEPWLTDQWYVDAETLAKPAIEAVETGKTKIVPENWSKTYFEWMRNIQPWCVSRQLWWGHQIPAWYGPDDEIFVAMDEAGAQAAADAHYGKPTEIVRDEDVLDTWFSSALWPFSTLGWPEKTPELDRYYPTDTLVTGFDILFFWVARMMMMGIHFMGEVPFHTVYIHALVRDEAGAKMSKSKGNVMDPLELIDDYGADAVRFTLMAMAAQGRDVKLSKQRIEGYRNFATKLWNAARFCEMNECAPVLGFDPAKVEQTANKWIVGEMARLSARVTESIDAYRFNDAANAIYQVAWGTFCDWYLELIKPSLMGGDEAAKAETRATCSWALDQILLVLHPFMPYITEELWQHMADSRDSMIIRASWPELDGSLVDAEAEAEMDWVVRLVSQIRAVRAEINVPAGAKVPMLLDKADAESVRRLNANLDQISRMARLSSAEPGSGEGLAGAVQIIHDEATVVLPLADVMDLDGEKARLGREIDKMSGEIDKIDKKLANENFTSKAPAHVIAEQHTRRADAVETRQSLEDARARLSAM
jgi:valyl-tRNA synthetase